MGKTKPKNAGKKGGGGPRAPAARLTPQQYFEQAQLALRFDDYDAARVALRKAVKLEPKNVEYIDALGALLAEIGPEDEAIEVLKQAVALSPDSGYEKYLYLGQLLAEQAGCEAAEAAMAGASTSGAGDATAAAAMAATRKGVAVLQAEQAAAQAAGSPDARRLSKALSGALCSLCEMVMARESAERERRAEAEGAGEGACSSGRGGVSAEVAAEVEHLISLASTADPHSPEPGQALASLRYEQGRAEEALESLRRSMSLWHTPSKDDDDEEDEEEEAGGKGDADMEDADGEGGSGEGGEGGEEDDGTPSYEFRVECAKLLLELDETTTTAIDVLEGLIEEDDRVPDAWHLLALAYYSGHQYAEAAEVLGRAQGLLAGLGLGPQDGITQVFAELEAAIKEALAMQGSAAGGAGGL